MISNSWVGCGECDTSFNCFDGQNRCIRLPHKEEFIKYEKKIEDLELEIERLMGNVPYGN